MNYPIISNILADMYDRIEEDTDIAGTIYETVEELLDDIQTYIEEMNDNNGNWIEYLDMHFQKNGNFQTIAIQNNWGTFWEEIVIQYKSATQVSNSK